jgi:hypothetical protein
LRLCLLQETKARFVFANFGKGARLYTNLFLDQR